MAKNDNAHALRLMSSLEKHGKHKEAEQFAKTHPLAQSADVEKKFDWAQRQCAFLETNFDAETVRAIRMDCACGPEMGKCKKLKAVYEKAADFFVFSEKVNALRLGFSVEYDGQSLYLIYPQCYCSCVKRMDKPLPDAWCHCTLGYAQRMFTEILGQSVNVALLSSVKRGDEACRIRIEP